jgi:hypothetical protein
MATLRSGDKWTQAPRAAILALHGFSASTLDWYKD